MKRFAKEIQDSIWEEYKKLQSEALNKREYCEDTSETCREGRSEYARDYARILYSSSFRRLQGKMQILGINSSAFYRNRLTHSLEVSQIARSLAKIIAWKCDKEKEMYCDNELYLLDAAALAHDIGHPAFGHKGERVLDEIAKTYKLRFEGNANNYSVLRRLEQHGSSKQGLNLTYRTLLAINKYIADENSSKCMYNDDYEFLDKFRKKENIENYTLDVQIIELADDIAYAVHDLEDGLSQEVFNIDELIFEIKNSKVENGTKAIEMLENLINNIKQELYKLVDNDNNKWGIKNLQQYSHLFRKRLVSKLTDEFIRSVDFDPSSNSKKLKLGGDYGILCKLLSKTIFTCITRRPHVALYEKRGEIVIKTLFNIYADIKKNPKFMLLPPDYRPKKNEQKKYIDSDIVRCCIDYIGGMMDTFAIAEFERLTGIKFDNIDISSTPDIYICSSNDNLTINIA